MQTLYFSPGSVAVAVAITLNEVGATYDAAKVDFKSGAQTQPDYHKINPKGRVPALVTDRGILTETSAILDYIAALYPQAHLVPDDPFKAAQMRSIMTFLASTWHVNHAMGGRGARWATLQSSFDDMKAKVTENINANCTMFETGAFQGPFAVGDQFTLADPYLFVATTWVQSDGVNIADYPRLHDFQQRMDTRPSVQKARKDGIL
jgi:glutathione S-transferase